MFKVWVAAGAALAVSWIIAPIGAGAAPLAVPALAPKTVDIVGEEKLSPDEFFMITYRFATRHLTVQQGATVTWQNKTNDGHTISVVAAADVPRTTAQVDNCGICNTIQAAHFPNGFPPQGVPVLFVDDFKAGVPPARFDSIGDSLIVAPPGMGLPTSVSAQITAPAGTTLNYICAFHPWMQATLRVVPPDEDGGQ